MTATCIRRPSGGPSTFGPLLYLRFMDAVKEAGAALAIPASTTYVEKDGFPPAAGEAQER